MVENIKIKYIILINVNYQTYGSSHYPYIIIKIYLLLIDNFNKNSQNIFILYFQLKIEFN